VNRISKKAAVIAVSAMIGLGSLGTAALAAFAPAPTDTFSLVPSLPGTAVAETPKADKLKAILDALVSKGVITQQQEDAIVAALKDAKGDKDRDALLRKIFAGLFEQSATYLGMTPADLKAKLPGTSLAAVANATAGKSRDGLVASLTAAVNDAIAKALADNKITQAQADKATAEAPAHIATFVDHTWPTVQPKTTVPGAPKGTAPRLAPTVQMFVGEATATARDYLGITQKDLVAAVRSGKSLGDVANATAGKSRDGLVAAITSAATARIDKAQQDSKLTADQAATLKAGLPAAVTQLVDRKGNAVKSH
jgi:hypothetical protein